MYPDYLDILLKMPDICQNTLEHNPCFQVYAYLYLILTVFHKIVL